MLFFSFLFKFFFFFLVRSEGKYDHLIDMKIFLLSFLFTNYSPKLHEQYIRKNYLFNVLSLATSPILLFLPGLYHSQDLLYSYHFDTWIFYHIGKPLNSLLCWFHFSDPKSFSFLLQYLMFVKHILPNFSKWGYIGNNIWGFPSFLLIVWWV